MFSGILSPGTLDLSPFLDPHPALVFALELPASS